MHRLDAREGRGHRLIGRSARGRGDGRRVGRQRDRRLLRLARNPAATRFATRGTRRRLDRGQCHRRPLGRQLRQDGREAGVGDPFWRSVNLTEMDGEGAIGRRQRRQALEERQQPLRHALRQHRGDNLFRAGLVAGHRQHESARPPCAAILLADQGIEQLQGRVALADDAERQSVTQDDLVIRAGLHRQPIIALRPLRLADQIVGEAAIAGITAHVISRRLGLREIAQRLAGPFRPDQDRAHTATPRR